MHAGIVSRRINNDPTTSHPATVCPQRASEIKREEAEAKERLSRNLNLGKRAYEVGEYMASVKLLEQAVQDVGPDTTLGGDAQLWLALAYQVRRRRATAARARAQGRGRGKGWKGAPGGRRQGG